MKISELTGAPLNSAVVKAQFEGKPMPSPDGLCIPAHSTNWEYSGPIIEQQKINTRWDDETLYGQPQNRWLAECASLGYAIEGPTALIAAMRCYVASKLGEEVDVPQELLS